MNMGRKIINITYDHVSVLLNKDEALHISPPKIRIISSRHFLMKKMEPLIIRPIF